MFRLTSSLAMVTVTLKVKRVTAALAISLLAVQDVQAENMFVGLGDLPGGSYFSRATDVSADGLTVVGFSETADGSQAFRWTAGEGLVGLGNPGDLSYAWAISGDGSVAVGSRDNGVNAEIRIQPYRWDTTSGVGTPVDAWVSGGVAYDVSADGSVIVGRREGTGGYGFRTENSVGSPALRSPQGWYSAAYAVSADGEFVVGSGFRAEGTPYTPGYRVWWEATKWDAPWPPWTAPHQAFGEGLGRLGGGDSAALAISSDGTTIVGESGNQEAVRFEPGGVTGLGHLPGDSQSSARAVSADGSLVFGQSGGDAFIWDAVNGMRSLEDVLEIEYGLNLFGWELSLAESSSADGTTIVGYGTNPDGHSEAWLARMTTPIPEPSSLLLLLTGALNLLACRWRRRPEW